jgi:hypothetical protein
VDQGTAFCFGQFQEETGEALLIARSEANYQDVILSTVIRSNDVYQLQQGERVFIHVAKRCFAWPSFQPR